MTVELTPVGVSCNLGCTYCYEDTQRAAGAIGGEYDVDAMLKAVEQHGQPFILFGGEPLLTKIDDLETLWAYGLDHFGTNGVQTNGTLITDAHIDLFRRYKVHVGFSIDGPGELNDVRAAGTLQQTREATEKSQAALERLLAEAIPCSLIVTLHRGNAMPEKFLPRLITWLETLSVRGLRTVRVHFLETEAETVNAGARLALTPAQLQAALEALDQLDHRTPLEFDLFRDVNRLLMGQDEKVSCVWRGCDPYTTAAVQGIRGDGTASNCPRTNKDGVDWQKADQPGYERTLVLAQTPHEDGGCQGCRFLLQCRGYCPGTAIDGDWRNRSTHCETLIWLFSRQEAALVAQGLVPLSQAPDRATLEGWMLEQLAAGRQPSLAVAAVAARVPAATTAVEAAASHTGHGDHTDAPDGYQHDDAGQTIHGDAGTTETHGDHTDA